MRPDPFTEIREALNAALIVDRASPMWPLAEKALAALARLEREAAERETALVRAEESIRLFGEQQERSARKRAELEARVREVEAERDKWKDEAVLRREHLAEALREAEATVARQAETLRTLLPYAEVQIRGQGDARYEDWDEHPALVAARAVLASPEAQTVASTGTLIPRDLGASIVDDHAHDLRMLASPEAAAAEPLTHCPQCHHKIIPIKAKTGPAFLPSRCGCGYEIAKRPTQDEQKASAEEARRIPDLRAATGRAGGHGETDAPTTAALPAVDAPPEPTT